MAARSSWAPDDLLFEIFLGQPVKAICRFKCLSKPMRSLLENPGFISQHLSISKKKKRSLIFYVNENNDPFMRLFDDQTLASYQQFSAKVNQHTFLSCCVYDGLVCLYSSKSDIALWNLATKEFRFLPPCNLGGDEFYGGFGWDSLSNDYKVIYLEEDSDDGYHCAVYTLSTDSWKVLNDEKRDHPYRLLSGKCVNGVHYWLGIADDHNCHVNLIAFHLDKEDFRLIDLPVGGIGELVVLPDDRLSLCSATRPDEGGIANAVWALNGDGESWAKILRIGPLFGGVGPTYGFLNENFDADNYQVQVYTYVESLVAIS